MKGSFTTLAPVILLPQAGFMIGTGVMVGLPGQTLRDLAGDILFFKEMGTNMIGKQRRLQAQL